MLGVMLNILQCWNGLPRSTSWWLALPLAFIRAFSIWSPTSACFTCHSITKKDIVTHNIAISQKFCLLKYSLQFPATTFEKNWKTSKSRSRARKVQVRYLAIKVLCSTSPQQEFGFKKIDSGRLSLISVCRKATC